MRYLRPKFIAYALFFMALTFVLGFFHSTRVSHDTNIVLDENRPPATIEDARRTTVKLYGQWRETGYVFDSTQSWTGSGVIVARDGNRLRIATNSHCLGLNALSQVIRLSSPDVGDYRLTIELIDGTKLSASRMAETPRHGLDIGLVEIDASTLEEGTSYRIASAERWRTLRVGEEVLAIGAPLGFKDTTTFGHVSALRVLDSSSGQLLNIGPDSTRNRALSDYMLIQTDAEFTHGNSGGALYAKRDSGWKLVGLPTYAHGERGELRFAFASDEIERSDWHWFSANPTGATQALSDIYQVN
jgi:S1-C subfamily serine protease